MKSEDIYDCVNKALFGIDRKSQREKEEKIEKARIEKQARIERQRIEKAERETRTKYWPNVKEDIYARYHLPIADDAKNIAKELSDSNTLRFGENLDAVSVFFITDERVVKHRYVEGGDKAIGEYAKHLTEHAFIGGPITATLLRRLKLLYDAKRDGKIIETEIDIDGFVPNGIIFYTVDEIELDGQVIPARRKFSIRCEMTATITEGFRKGPFVLYDELYISTKEEMEQITDEDIKSNTENKDDTGISTGYEKTYNVEVCHHGTDITLYCNQCNGDIIVTPSKKIIGICLDISGSMEGNTLLKAKTAVIKVLRRIPTDKNIDVVLIVFGGDLSMNYEDIIPFGMRYTESGRNMAIKRVSDIRSGGSTPLYDAVNYFLDEIWSGGDISGERRFVPDGKRIFYPYTYLILVSDGGENGSELSKLIYKGKIGSDAFLAKLNTYRNAGLVTEVIPFAYGYRGTNSNLLKELRKISGKKLINEVDKENIIESLVGNVDSILYGVDNLKMMGYSMGKKNMKNSQNENG